MSYKIKKWQGRRKQDQWFEVASIINEKIEGRKKIKSDDFTLKFSWSRDPRERYCISYIFYSCSKLNEPLKTQSKTCMRNWPYRNKSDQNNACSADFQLLGGYWSNRIKMDRFLKTLHCMHSLYFWILCRIKTDIKLFQVLHWSFQELRELQNRNEMIITNIFKWQARN